jgi:hypothetical protein
MSSLTFEDKYMLNFIVFVYGVNMLHYMRFDVFTAVKIQVNVFWVVTPYSDVVEHQCFGGPCCLHLQGEMTSSPSSH